MRAEHRPVQSRASAELQTRSGSPPRRRKPEFARRQRSRRSYAETIRPCREKRARGTARNEPGCAATWPRAHSSELLQPIYKMKLASGGKAISALTKLRFASQ